MGCTGGDIMKMHWRTFTVDRLISNAGMLMSLCSDSVDESHRWRHPELASEQITDAVVGLLQDQAKLKLSPLPFCLCPPC